eukprot:scaffold70079_cov62-Phaeocystis_antarctica.AAC.4
MDMRRVAHASSANSARMPENIAPCCALLISQRCRASRMPPPLRPWQPPSERASLPSSTVAMSSGSHTMSADSVSFLDHTKQPADLELAGKCRSALAQRLERQPYKAPPPSQKQAGTSSPEAPLSARARLRRPQAPG